MKLSRIIIIFLVFIYVAAGFSGCDSVETKEATEIVSEFSNLTQETKDLLFQHFDDDIASAILFHLVNFEKLGLTMHFDRVEENLISIDILPDVPFGLVDAEALETFFDFGVFISRYLHMAFPFLPPTPRAGFSEALHNEIKARDGLSELYQEIGNRVHIENFMPWLVWTLNEYSNFNQKTIDFLRYRFIGPPPWEMTAIAPEIQTFMRFLQIFETELGLTMKFNTVVIDGILYEVYIDRIPNVPFGLTDADAIEIFLDFRYFVINETDIRPDIDFASFDGISQTIIDELKTRDGLLELFMEVLEQRQ